MAPQPLKKYVLAEIRTVKQAVGMYEKDIAIFSLIPILQCSNLGNFLILMLALFSLGKLNL